MKNATMSVKGMHCPSCISLIKMNLGEMPGIESISGDPEKGIVKVCFDEKKASLNEIIQKIEQDTYKVTKSEMQKE